MWCSVCGCFYFSYIDECCGESRAWGCTVRGFWVEHLVRSRPFYNWTIPVSAAELGQCSQRLGRSPLRCTCSFPCVPCVLFLYSFDELFTDQGLLCVWMLKRIPSPSFFWRPQSHRSLCGCETWAGIHPPCSWVLRCSRYMHSQTRWALSVPQHCHRTFSFNENPKPPV